MLVICAPLHFAKGQTNSFDIKHMFLWVIIRKSVEYITHPNSLSRVKVINSNYTFLMMHNNVISKLQSTFNLHLSTCHNNAVSILWSLTRMETVLEQQSGSYY